LDSLIFLKGLLDTRRESLWIRPLKYDIVKHANRDPGCRGKSAVVLASYVRTHDYAIVVFDHHGCGREKSPCDELEAEIETVLATSWGDRIAVIVIDPELEAWVWTKPSHVPHVIGWSVDQSLPDWLVEKKFFDLSTQVKPAKPKEALDAALQQVGRKHSSDIFLVFAEKISFRNCTDPAFLKLLTTLRKWFPADQ